MYYILEVTVWSFLQCIAKPEQRPLLDLHRGPARTIHIVLPTSSGGGGGVQGIYRNVNHDKKKSYICTYMKKTTEGSQPFRSIQ